VPEQKILLQLGTPKVEMTIAKAQFFGCQIFTLPPRDGNRRRVRRPQYLQRRSADLDVTGLYLWISHFGWAHRNFSDDAYDGLLPEPPGRFDHIGGCPLRVEGNLNDAGAIPKVDKNDSAEVPGSMNPAGHGHTGSSIPGTQRPGPVRAQGGREDAFVDQ